ncbi:MAG: hypothetical protein ACK6CT_02680 [Planctomycetia bacterium]
MECGERAALAAFAGVAAWFGSLVLAASGMLVLARRLGGAFAVPAGSGKFFFLLVGGAVMLAVTVQVCRMGRRPAAATIACVGFAAAILAIGLPADLASWATSATPSVAVLAASLALVGPVAFGRPAAFAPRPRPEPRGPETPAPRRRRRRSRPDASAPPRCVSQRQERFRLASGEDCIRGRIHLEVPAGARVVHGHMGFCPAFAALPEVRVETPYDGVEATVSAAEIVPWGVRIECRLAEPAEEPIVIPVLVVATTRV